MPYFDGPMVILELLPEIVNLQPENLVPLEKVITLLSPAKEIATPSIRSTGEILLLSLS